MAPEVKLACTFCKKVAVGDETALFKQGWVKSTPTDVFCPDCAPPQPENVRMTREVEVLGSEVGATPQEEHDPHEDITRPIGIRHKF